MSSAIVHHDIRQAPSYEYRYPSMSDIERKEAMSETREHWLAVGRVSNAARKRLIEANCPVVDGNSKPPVVLVCLRDETATGHFSENMAFTNVGEIEISVKGLCLLWRFPDAWQVAYASITETELVTCDE